MTKPKMISRIGSKRRPDQKGMTLIEALLSVVILATGIVAVFQPMLTSFVGLRYAEQRLAAYRFMNDQLWHFEEEAWRMKRFPPGLQTDTLIDRTRVFQYKGAAIPIGATKRLYRLHGEMSWNVSGVDKKIQAERYAYLPAPRGGEQ